MKRCILALTALIVLAMFVVQPANATTSWMTYREDISISAVTVDIDYTTYHNDTTTETYDNITLPCPASELTNASTLFHINSTAGTNVTYNLTVNGTSIVNNGWVNGTSTDTNLSTILTSDSGISDDTWLNFTFDCNQTGAYIWINITASDASCSATWVTSVQTVKEKDVNTPEIGVGSTTSFMTVNDSLNITHTVGYSLQDVNATLSYPSHAVSSATYQNFGTVANNSGVTKYKQYQKYGPYVYDVDDDTEGTEHSVDVYIKSNELLTLTVDYDLTTSDDVYENYFDTLNYDTLDVELNNADVDWEEGSIVMEELTMKDGWSVNHFTFTWSEAVTPPAEEEVAWYAQNLFGIAIYLWLAIIAVIAVVGVLIVVYVKD